MELILDTNFLIYLVKAHLIEDIRMGCYKLVILDSVEKEIKKLANSGNPEAAVLESLLEKLNARRVKTSVSNVDRSIVALAKEMKKEGVVVGTMDRGLTLKLKKEGIRTLIIRGKKKLCEM